MNPHDRLYELLPVYYRQRDAEMGGPLRSLLAVISEQVGNVEADIQQLYDNWFIETCQDWVVPYIADLIGYRVVHGAGDPSDIDGAHAQLRNQFLIPRADVANTIRNRRRKGTLSLLQDLAWDVARWPAHAIELETRLGSTQSLNHVHPHRGKLAELHDDRSLKYIGSMLDPLARSVDVRRGNSRYQQGKYGLGQVAIFIARLKSYPLTRSEAFCVEEVGRHCFTFNPGGHDTALFRSPSQSRSYFPDEPDLPSRLTLADVEQFEIPDDMSSLRVSEKFYGENKSFAICARGWANTDPHKPVPREQVIPANLSHWDYKPLPGTLAIDPERGRIVFPPAHVPEAVWVDYHYGFSTSIGGGEYRRTFTSDPKVKVYRVRKEGAEEHNHIREALHRWKHDGETNARIDILDSSVYDEENVSIDLKEGQKLEIRAMDGARPVLRIVEWQSGRSNGITIKGETRSKLTINGLLVTGRGLQVKGPLEEICLRHSTLVPGWGLHNDSKPKYPSEPSILLDGTDARLVIEDSITGAIHVVQNEPEHEPSRISISDSVLDATSITGTALCAPGPDIAYAQLSIIRCTVIGHVETHAIELAENSIFASKITVARRQFGCVRFCYLAPSSRTPRQFDCQPQSGAAGLTGEEKQERLAGLRPVFNSTRYSAPDYCQLAEACPPEIKGGADDQSEMGVFHDLFEPQREANLRTRLDEYLPASTDAAIILVN